MGLDFRGIFVSLRRRFERRRLRAALTLLLLSRSVIDRLTYKDKAVAADLEASDPVEAAQQKSRDENQLFAAVGQALSFWAQTEENLVAISGMLLRTTFPMAGVIMYSIINFHVRLNIIDDLFSISPHYGSLKPKWNKIAQRLRATSEIRDRLAHHTIHSGPKVPQSDPSLNPARFDTRQKAQKYEPLNFDQISRFTLTVAKITHDAADLINAMGELDASREKPPE
jgi:hypothetical protein